MYLDKPLILVVEDEQDNREVLSFLLADEGYDVILASNGREGVRKAREGVAAILMDIDMPEVDGISACKILQAREDARDIPVLFLTAFKGEIWARQALQAGGLDFINKPIAASELHIKVAAALRVKELGGDPRAAYAKAVEEETLRYQQAEGHSDREWFKP